MSKYEWESGTIKIPSKEWPKFRTAVITCWNKHQLDLLEKAKRLHTKLKDAAKGKRGMNRHKAIHEALKRSGHEYDYDIQRLVIESRAFDHEKKCHLYTLKGLPKKKDLGLLATSKDARIHVSDATVILSNKERTVTWDVGENNRACERARETFLGRELFRLLGRITWTRGSGGKIVGNDEYNRDADYEGGGGNYVTAEFSAEAQKREKEAAKRARLAPLPMYGGGFGPPLRRGRGW